jgi:stringent starvation protein B
MIKDILEDVSFKNLTENQIYEQIEYLLNKDEQFSVTANINGVSFDPAIPESIAKNFSRFTLFALMNYTYETLQLTEENISFEAGFGQENFVSTVKVPLNAIFQIVVDESILYINPTATIDAHFDKREDSTDQKTRSMNAFKMNNKDLF